MKMTVVVLGILVIPVLTTIGSAQQAARKTYNLVVAGGPLGPHLRQAVKSCKELREAAQVTGAPNTHESNPCGVNRGLGRIEGHGLTLDELAGMIGSPSGFVVVNRTGLTGPYDWELRYTPDNLRNHAPDRFKDVDPNGPSVFVAVEQQLGLKLEEAR